MGNYICNLDTTAATVTNSPTGGKAFALKVGDLLNDGKYPYQEITRYTDGASWRRTFNMASSTWNVWYSTSFAPSKKSLWTGSWSAGSITVNNIQDYSAFVFYSSTGATLIGFMNADKTSINCYGIICPESNIMKLESATIAVSGTTLTRTIPRTWTLTGTAISSADAALVFTRIEGLFYGFIVGLFLNRYFNFIFIFIFIFVKALYKSYIYVGMIQYYAESLLILWRCNMGKYLSEDGLTLFSELVKNWGAEKGHKHSAADITSGVLPIERGGTGGGTANDARNNLDVYSKTEVDMLAGVGKKHWGVKIARDVSDPATAVEYIGDAEGMSPGWNNWKDTALFRDIRPCVLKDGNVEYYLNPDNYAQKEDGTASTINSFTDGDVMVEIPKMGYKMTMDDDYHYVWVTNDPDDDTYCYAAHSKETLGDCDRIYIGAYLGHVDNKKLYSVSGADPTTNISLINSRAYANARGDGYELFSFYPMTLLQCLFLLIYKTRNSQAALGQGYTSASAKVNTGATDALGFMYGASSATTHVKYLGIEDFWGNCLVWVDGCYSDASRNILTYYKNFDGVANGTNYQWSVPSGVDSDIGNYMSEIVGTTHGGFVAKAVGGSASTYYTDWAGLYAGRVPGFGGAWSNGAGAGAFRLLVIYSPSGVSARVTARLLYKDSSSQN